MDVLCRNGSSYRRSILALIASVDASAADFAWRRPDMHREQAPEVADILIANRPGDLGNREPGRQHQPRSQLHTPGNHVLVRRKAYAGFETAREMKGAEVDQRDQIFKG
jgi:hypothetical protein